MCSSRFVILVVLIILQSYFKLYDCISCIQSNKSVFEVVNCGPDVSYCYFVWTVDKNHNPPSTKDNRYLNNFAGCWSAASGCDSDICEPEKTPHPYNSLEKNQKFCCCKTDNCNSIDVVRYMESVDEKKDFLPTNVQKHQAVTMENSPISLTLIGCISFVSVLVICCVVSAYCYKQTKESQTTCGSKKKSHSKMYHFNPKSHADNVDVKSLEITSNLIGSGRFSSVYLGYNNDETVAVKVFQNNARESFLNERDIYNTSHMKNSYILEYLASTERRNERGSLEFILVFPYYSKGCLHDFLKENTLDMTVMLNVFRSIANALAYLHTDLKKDGETKPCICHRDLTTKNILVKSDMTFVLCDMTLAVKLSGSHYVHLYEERNAEISPITDVGTLQYMSPEMLEGAVNLRDCETSLKQCDVYALAMVLWETSMRCTDLYHVGVQIPPHRVPFELELGTAQPTLEAVNVIANHNKMRPVFSLYWRDNAITRQIKETIEDCWDQDAEARLTSMCVAERLNELNHSVNNKNRLSFHSKELLSGMPRNPNITNELHGLSVSSETVCTILPGTPSDVENSNPSSSQPVKDTNKVAESQNLSQELPAHQGINRCMERNTWTENLISSSKKNQCSSTSINTKPILNTLSEDLLLCNETKKNKLINKSPISYVQNFSNPNSTVNLSDSTNKNLETNFIRGKKLNNNIINMTISPFEINQFRPYSLNLQRITSSAFASSSSNNNNKYFEDNFIDNINYLPENLNTAIENFSFDKQKNNFQQNNIQFIKEKFLNEEKKSIEFLELENEKINQFEEKFNQFDNLNSNNENLTNINFDKEKNQLDKKINLNKSIKENTSTIFSSMNKNTDLIKKSNKTKKNSDFTKIIIDSTKKNSDNDNKNSETTIRSYKDLNERIKTPGDIPESIRKKREKKSRLALFENNNCDENLVVQKDDNKFFFSSEQHNTFIF